jgi:hypothetical protein
MKTSKIVLVWIGDRCLNLQWAHGVSFVDWLFHLSPKLRAA